MFIRAVLVLALLGATADWVSIARADSQVSGADGGTPHLAKGDVAALADAIHLMDVLEVMRQEGIAHAPEMAADLFAGESGGNWSAVIGRVYDTRKMRAEFEARLASELSDDDASVAAGLAFFRSDLGQRIVGLEIGARKTLMEKAAKETAERAYAQLATANPTRTAQLDRYVARNDLVESNVMGALNANLAFLRGLSLAGPDGSGPMAKGMTEEKMLADVWGQETTIRKDTVEWLFPFLTLAYQPLSNAEMEEYIAFSETVAGKHLNAAFFVAFDAMFVGIYTELGRAAALQIQGQDI
jgi:hypothetical protein